MTSIKRATEKSLRNLKRLSTKYVTKYNRTKFIISEITPRNDDRDAEVKLFNSLLLEYTKRHRDISMAFHHNLRDRSWSMFSDAKHIHPNKVAKFAANIIKALKKSYNINDKSELFPQSTQKIRPLMDCPVPYRPAQIISPYKDAQRRSFNPENITYV